ncbi:MAG: threonine synthase [Acidobacteria bacterium]|nr:threonine synthase [Acidobacteriota bacterium]
MGWGRLRRRPRRVACFRKLSRFEHELVCSSCQWRSPPDRLYGVCPACNDAPILVDWHLPSDLALADEIDQRRPAGIWRFGEVLPFEADGITLGEGGTPLVPTPRLGAELGLDHLWFKDESRNPTRSFKSRGMAAAVTAARALGAKALTIPTAGNAGCALAAYGRKAGLPVFVAMPRDTPTSIEQECREYGAIVERVEGVITDAAIRSRQWAEENGGFDLSTLREPYRVEGKKTMGYELFFDLGRQLPDLILYPTGGGTGLIGMWKAFGEMERLGWLGRHRPRMIAVQAAGCAPVVEAFHSGAARMTPWEKPQTEAWGLRVPRAFGDRLMLLALRESGGDAVAVPEESIEPAAARIREREKIDAGPETGAALAALEQLVAKGVVERSEKVVVFNTGGDKYRA